MKLFLILVLLIASFTLVAFEFKPYGSARMAGWYEMENEDYSQTGEQRLNLNYFMQSNSRFGARFNHDDLLGVVEFGGLANLRHLYAKYDFGSWNLLVGQTYSGIMYEGIMAYNNDWGMNGYGAIDDLRKPQIRFGMKNGLYATLLCTHKADVSGITQDKTVLFPKMNFGYSNKLNEMVKLHATLGVNQYTYDKDAGAHDFSILAYVGAVTMNLYLGDMEILLSGNYGQNTANYGLTSTMPNLAMYDSVNDEIVNVTTLGGYGEFYYKMNPSSMLALGAGFVQSNSDNFNEADSAMAAYLQFRKTIKGNIHLIPEAGMLNKMKDSNGNEQGNMIYFGTQLRLDF